MKWLCDDGNAEIEIEADTAHKAAQEYVDGGDWGEDDKTYWIDVWVWPAGADPDHQEHHTIALEPEEPDCLDDHEHHWDDYSVQGHGGGVYCTEVCLICGLWRTVDSWAQNPTTGEQGLHSTEYEPGRGCEAIEAQMRALVEDISWDDFAKEISELPADYIDAVESLIEQIANDISVDEPHAYQLRAWIEWGINEQLNN